MIKMIEKEVSDALHVLLHCALKDKEYETQKEQFSFVYDYIFKLENNWNELKKWLEECLNEIKQNDVYDRTSYEQGQIIALESSIAKVQELEQWKDENN